MISPTTVVGVAAVLVIAGLGTLYYDEKASHAATKVVLANERTAWAGERTAAKDAALKQSEDHRAKEAEWRKQQETRDAESAVKSETLRRAAAGLDARRVDVLRQFTALAATCGRTAADPGAQPGGAPTSAAGDLLTELYRRADEDAAAIADFADHANAAGERCVIDYEALRR